MMALDLLEQLQQWYASNCDGDWEHDWGVRIGTLDNPGWSLDVNLEGTVLEGRAFAEQRVDTTDTDWYLCRVRGNVFEGRGGALNLRDILQAFVLWWKGEVDGPGEMRKI